MNAIPKIITKTLIQTKGQRYKNKKEATLELTWQVYPQTDLA